jgi:hypothetical protein
MKLAEDPAVSGKYPTGMRLDSDIKAALAGASVADGRSVSNMLDGILRLWLTEDGAGITTCRVRLLMTAPCADKGGDIEFNQ